MNKKSIGIWNILKILKRRGIWIFFWSVLGGVLLWFISARIITPEYTTSASLYVYSSTDRSAANDAGITSLELTASQQLADTYGVIIQSDTVLGKVIKQMGLSVTEEELRKMIEVSSVNSTEVLSISVTDTDPQRTQEIANTIVEVLPDELVRVVKAGGIEVVDYAKVPDEPVFPNVWMNTIAGILVGMLCSSGVFFMKEYLNTKINSEKDLEECFEGEIPILGTIPMLDGKTQKEKNHGKK